jgi:hypothetical protein
MAKKSTSPQIVNPYAPLEQLVLRVIKRYGEMAASTVEGETIQMFIDYANSILDDIMSHPYWTKGQEISYYTHQTEWRAVPDTVMVAGLLAKFSSDQESKKAQVYLGEYYLRLNQVLARWKFGVGAQFELQAVDVDGGGVV